MDYRDLIKKYMTIVMEHEGISFLRFWDDVETTIFTEAEVKELEQIEKEIHDIVHPKETA